MREDLQGNWRGPNIKDTRIRNSYNNIWEGLTPPRLNRILGTDKATCIDNLAIRDPQNSARQIGPSAAVETAFLDHKGVLGTTIPNLPHTPDPGRPYGS